VFFDEPTERTKMMSSTKGARVSRPALILLGVGFLLIVAYVLLSHFRIGKFGAESDIGGGLILLAGYSLAGLGAVMAILGLKRR
jgi:hypothetical protein